MIPSIWEQYFEAWWRWRWVLFGAHAGRQRWGVARPDSILRSRWGGRQEATICKVSWMLWGVTTALLLQDLTVNPPFISHIPSKPCIRPLVPGWATCAAAAAAAAASETDGGSERQQRSTVARLPSNTPETSEYSLPRIPFTKKEE